MISNKIIPIRPRPVLEAMVEAAREGKMEKFAAIYLGRGKNKSAPAATETDDGPKGA